MKKKIIFVLSITVPLMILLTIGITIAYLSNKPDDVTNTVSVTEGKVSIEESFPVVSEQSMNNEFTKEVQIKNTGTTPCFVRVFVDFSDSTIRDNSKTKIVKADGTTQVTWSEFIENPGTNWEYVSNDNDKLNGYFYYKKILNVGGSTDYLLRKVFVDYRANDEDSNIDKITDFEMIVYAETVQTTEITTDGTSKVYTDSDWKTAWESFLKIPTP